MANEEEQVIADAPNNAWNEEFARELEDHSMRILQLVAKYTERAELDDQLTAWRVERRRLLDCLSKAEAQLAQSASATALIRVDDLQQRLQMALDEIRRLKANNTKLEQQLAAAQTKGAAAPGPVTDNLTWEAQKQRLLARLESEFGTGEELPTADRSRIEETVRITDHALAVKDREIRELKQLLEEQSRNISGLAVGASAIGALIDQDEIVVQERVKLQALQTEWHDKLRKAEIEISTERAKLARERIALEERLIAAERTMARPAAADSANNRDKPMRGHWLARLGLRELDE